MNKVVLAVFAGLSPLHALSIRRASTYVESWLEQLQNMVKAVDWQAADDWINHDPYNVIDGFRLQFEDVMEARDETMAKYHLTQI